MAVGGYKTVPFVEGGKRIGFYIKDFCDERVMTLEEKKNQMIGEIIGYRKIKPYLGVFDGLGVGLIDKAMQKNRIIILDEIGIIESDAELFKLEIMKCLNSKEHIVICSLRDDESDFLRDIKKTENSYYFYIESDKRNERYEEIKSLIKRKIIEKGV